jgi:hypothetical protein
MTPSASCSGTREGLSDALDTPAPPQLDLQLATCIHSTVSIDYLRCEQDRNIIKDMIPLISQHMNNLCIIYSLGDYTIICVADWEKGSFGIRRSKVNFCTDLLPQSLHYLNPRGGSQKFSI